MICNEAISIRKESNIEGHCDTKYATIFEKFKGQFHEDEVSELRSKTSGMQSLFKDIQSSSVSELLVKVSYIVAAIIVKKVLSENNFFRECFDGVADIPYPQGEKNY